MKTTTIARREWFVSIKTPIVDQRQLVYPAVTRIQIVRTARIASNHSALPAPAPVTANRVVLGTVARSRVSL